MMIKNLNVSAKQNLTLNSSSNFNSHRIKKKKLITNIKYNKMYKDFDIIKLENYEGAIGPGETKYIIAYFRTLAEINYDINLTLHYTDETKVFQEQIKITGIGYINKKEIDIEKPKEKRMLLKIRKLSNLELVL